MFSLLGVAVACTAGVLTYRAGKRAGQGQDSDDILDGVFMDVRDGAGAVCSAVKGGINKVSSMLNKKPEKPEKPEEKK